MRGDADQEPSSRAFPVRWRQCSGDGNAHQAAAMLMLSQVRGHGARRPGPTRSVLPTLQHETVGLHAEQDLADHLVRRGRDEKMLGDRVYVAKATLEWARGENRCSSRRRVHAIDNAGRGPPSHVSLRSAAARAAPALQACPPGPSPTRAWSPRPKERAPNRAMAMASQTAICVVVRVDRVEAMPNGVLVPARRSSSSIAARAMPSADAAIPTENNPTMGKRNSAPSCHWVEQRHRARFGAWARRRRKPRCRCFPSRAGQPCPRCR